MSAVTVALLFGTLGAIVCGALGMLVAGIVALRRVRRSTAAIVVPALVCAILGFVLVALYAGRVVTSGLGGG